MSVSSDDQLRARTLSEFEQLGAQIEVENELLSRLNNREVPTGMFSGSARKKYDKEIDKQRAVVNALYARRVKVNGELIAVSTRLGQVKAKEDERARQEQQAQQAAASARQAAEAKRAQTAQEREDEEYFERTGKLPVRIRMQMEKAAMEKAAAAAAAAAFPQQAAAPPRSTPSASSHFTEIPRFTCSACNGAGFTNCINCSGSGKKYNRPNDANPYDTCGMCHAGSGRRTCGGCNGVGRRSAIDPERPGRGALREIKHTCSAASTACTASASPQIFGQTAFFNLLFA